MVQSYTFATIIFVAFMSSTCAVSVTFKNNCANDVKLVLREGGKAQETSWPLSPQGSTSTSFGKGFEGNFRLGDDDAATLVEFSTKGAMNLVWYDISVIPSQLNPGFEFCSSHEECIANSKSKKGFNTAVQMTPVQNSNGNQCRELTCLDPTCSDAYLFPKDDTKTHACLLETDFTVTFCPGDNQVPEPKSAAPEPTKVAPEPETATPETTAAPEPETAAPEPIAAPEPDTAVPEPGAAPKRPTFHPIADRLRTIGAPTSAPNEPAPAASMPPPELQSPTITPVVYPVPTPPSNGNFIQDQVPASAPPQTVDQTMVAPPRDHCE